MNSPNLILPHNYFKMIDQCQFPIQCPTSSSLLASLNALELKLGSTSPYSTFLQTITFILAIVSPRTYHKFLIVFHKVREGSSFSFLLYLDTMNSNAVTVLEILSLTFTLAQAQFYFCLNGPQRIKSDDCDYGLVLAKQTGSQCVGAVKEQQDLG